MRFLVPPCALIAAALLAADARSQPGPQVKDGKYVLALTASPAAPAVPALRYTLLPTTRDTRPGNQIPAFYKCFMEQSHLFFDKDEAGRRDTWLAAPLADLKGVKELVGYGGTAFRQAQKAARGEYVDWQIAADLKADGINLLLPDIQQMRALATVLRVRARGEIARGDFPAAVETIQTNLALARTLNDHPTLIGSLVGIAVSAIALSSVEEFVAQPGAPNLFWALADLPAPLFDLRKAGHGERTFLTAEFAPFLDRKNPMSEAQIGAAVMKAAELMRQLGPPPAKGDKPEDDPTGLKGKTVATYLGERAADAKQVAEARAKLLPTPPTRDLRVEQFAPMQVILIDEFDRFEASRDDVLKWLTIPTWQLPPDADKLAAGAGVFAPFAPAVLKVSIARTRLQQQVGMLQVVEAVRAHAAANGGALPPTLDAIRLPVPHDPFTGKPFRYEVRGRTAVVRGTPPPGREGDPNLNRVYEVVIRK